MGFFRCLQHLLGGVSLQAYKSIHQTESVPDDVASFIREHRKKTKHDRGCCQFQLSKDAVQALLDAGRGAVRALGQGSAVLERVD